MHINQVSNVNFNGKIWLAGKYIVDNENGLREIANSPESFKQEMRQATKGIHFDTKDVNYLCAINNDLCVLHIYDENKILNRVVVPYNLEFIINAYNAAKDGLDIDLRGAGKETFWK